MKKIGIIILLNVFLSANLFAGCMKSEIKQIDAKLKSDNISVEKKAEIKTKIDIFLKHSSDHNSTIKCNLDYSLTFLEQSTYSAFLKNYENIV